MTKKHVELSEDGSATGKVIFTFDDQTTETFDLSKVSEAIFKRLAIHGASQKCGDSYAGAASESDPVEFAKAAVRDTIAQLYAGDWRTTVGGGAARVPALALALSRIPAVGKTLEECIAFVETLDKDQTKAWKAKGKVAAELLKISAERKAEAAKRAAEKLAKLQGTEEGKEQDSDGDLDFSVPEKEDEVPKALSASA